MSEEIPIVLVAEPKSWQQLKWADDDKLRGKVRLVGVFSLSDARKELAKNKAFAAFVIDDCQPHDVHATPRFVQEIRPTFVGPMIATSRFADYQKWLVSAGCNHEAGKDELPDKLLQILEL